MTTICKETTPNAKLGPAALEDRLRRQIRSGELQPGDRLPTFRKLKADWGVPQYAAQRVFRTLSEEGLILVGQTRSGICVAEPKARAAGVIGFLSRDPNLEVVPYWSHLLQGMRQSVEEKGWHLSVMRETSPMSMWRDAGGIVFASELHQDLLSVRPVGKPAVALLHGSPVVSSVTADDFGGVQAAMHHLMDLGHRRIGYMLGVNEASLLTVRRAQAYDRAFVGSGIVPDPRWRFDVCLSDADGKPFDGTVEMGQYTMRELLRGQWQELGCTALLAANDDVAIGIIQALQEAGIRVPEDVSVVGFDGTEVSTYFTPSLTTVQVPLREIGRRGGDLLLHQIESGQTTEDEVVLPVHLKVRATTAPCPTTRSRFLNGSA